MRNHEIEIGGTYSAKLSGKMVRVLIVAVHELGGWKGENLNTKRSVQIKSARKLRELLAPSKAQKKRKGTMRNGEVEPLAWQARLKNMPSPVGTRRRCMSKCKRFAVEHMVFIGNPELPAKQLYKPEWRGLVLDEAGNATKIIGAYNKREQAEAACNFHNANDRSNGNVSKKKMGRVVVGNKSFLFSVPTSGPEKKKKSATVASGALPPVQQQTINALRTAGQEQTPREVAARSGVKPTTIRVHLARLQRKGLAENTPKGWRVTAKGETCQRKI